MCFCVVGCQSLAAGLDLELYAKTGVRGVVVNAGHMTRLWPLATGLNSFWRCVVSLKVKACVLWWMMCIRPASYDLLARIGVRHMRGDHMDQLRADHAKSVAGKVA